MLTMQMTLAPTATRKVSSSQRHWNTFTWHLLILHSFRPLNGCSTQKDTHSGTSQKKKCRNGRTNLTSNKDTLTCQIFCAYEEVMLDMSYKPEILATYLKLFKLQYTLIFKNKNILFRNYIIILCEIYIKTYFASVTFFFISTLYDW